jgi:hypothetical protein
MSTAVLTFDASGSGSCLYTELIDLQQLGSLKIERASTIEFNESGQVWEVRAEGELLFSNRSRAVCLAWEHQYFNR